MCETGSCCCQAPRRQHTHTTPLCLVPPAPHNPSVVVGKCVWASRDRVCASTFRTEDCAHADKCQYPPYSPLCPGTLDWADDNLLLGSVFDWSAPCVAG